MYLKFLLVLSLLPRLIRSAAVEAGEPEDTLPPENATTVKAEEEPSATELTAIPTNDSFIIGSNETIYIPPIPRAIAAREGNAGGFNCRSHWYPYFAYIGRYAAGYCAGTILAPSYILTAGHCCYGYELHGIYAGYYHDRNTWDQFANAARVIIHGQYDNSTFQYDACIIQLDKPLEPTKTIQFITLNPRWKANSEVFFVGYPSNHSSDTRNFLELATMPCIEATILSEEKCKHRMNKNDIEVSRYDPETMICSEPNFRRTERYTEADAGGPLIMSNQQIGISSFALATKKGVGLTFHAKIDSVFEFIHASTRARSPIHQFSIGLLLLLLVSCIL